METSENPWDLLDCRAVWIWSLKTREISFNGAMGRIFPDTGDLKRILTKKTKPKKVSICLKRLLELLRSQLEWKPPCLIINQTHPLHGLIGMASLPPVERQWLTWEKIAFKGCKLIPEDITVDLEWYVNGKRQAFGQRTKLEHRQNPY